ncbi:MAG: LOW QUALITY PROTEIN: Oxysterol-binding protein-domain-containing protein, partial [Olpidium bornovanus]
EIVLEDDSLDEDDNNVGDAQREDEDDEVDDDEEDFSSDMFEARNGTGKSGMGRLSAAGRVPKDSVTTDAAPPSTVPVRASFAAPVQRRHLLPATACVETASIVSIFRKNVGKDFSTIPMPVTTSEPISILQKLAENLEYSELLDIACKQADSATRMLYVAAFVVSGYSNGRGARKPFNPMLGETYELVREDKGFRFIAEKVSHYPVITAVRDHLVVPKLLFPVRPLIGTVNADGLLVSLCHAESEEWVYWHDSRVKAKFWGKSMVR